MINYQVCSVSFLSWILSHSIIFILLLKSVLDGHISFFDGGWTRPDNRRKVLWLFLLPLHVRFPLKSFILKLPLSAQLRYFLFMKHLFTFFSFLLAMSRLDALRAPQSHGESEEWKPVAEWINAKRLTEILIGDCTNQKRLPRETRQNESNLSERMKRGGGNEVKHYRDLIWKTNLQILKIVSKPNDFA